MSQVNFAIDPAFLGLPTREDFIELRIWDLHYHGTDVHEEMMEYVDRMGVERVISLDIGGGWGAGGREQGPEEDERHRELLEEWRDRMAGIIRIDPSQPDASLEHMENWIANGPAIGIKYAGGNQGGVTCDHPNNDAIIERASELGAVIYIHTYLKVGSEEPRYPGAANNPGESTPMEVAELAARFPDVPMICGHSGSDWELGARAIRPHENIFFEYSGSPSWAGMVDYGINWLGVDRLVWGGHGESRPYATEMSKVLSADVDFEGMKKIFGENLRRLAVPIMQEKGYEVEI